MAQRVGVAVIVVVGLLGGAWAAQPHADRQVFSCQSTEASDGDVAPEQPHPRGWFQEWFRGVRDQCACRDRTGAIVSRSLFALPGCLAKNFLDTCNRSDRSDSRLAGLVILAVFSAVLMRQTALGYRQNWRLSFALFLTLFLGITIFGVSTLGVELLAVPNLVNFIMIFFVSVCLGGVLAFWARYLLNLLVVAAGASLLAFLIDLADLKSMQIPLIVVVGIAGGLWLHWWRDRRQKPQAPVGRQGPPAAHGDGERQGVQGKSE